MTKQTAESNKKLIDRGSFAVRLRALRKEKGMTQTELAEKIGTTRSSIANWENGSRFPEVRYMQTMARIFAVPIDYLCGKSKHRYNINVPDYFEFDMTKLNSKGIDMLYKQYKLLLNSDEYTK